MKILLICLFALALSSALPHKAHLTNEQKAKAQVNSLECILETGVNPELVMKAKKGELSNDPAFKKFIFCFFKKAGIVNEQGKINEATALAKLPADVDKEAIKKVIQECNNKSGSDSIETAFQVFKCYRKNTPTHIEF